MAASYKKLFELLIDREMKSKDLAAKVGISSATLAKMKKDGATVSSDVFVKTQIIQHKSDQHRKRRAD